MRGGVVLALQHRLEPVDAGADRLDGVVGAFLQAVPQQDLLRLQRIGGVGRIDHQRAAAQVGERLDLRLDEEFVHAAVAAGDDHHVLLGDLDHGERVVDRGMDDVELAGGEPFALALRILGEVQVDLEPALLEDAVGDAGMQRQRLGVREGVDAQFARRLRVRGADEYPDRKRDCQCESYFHCFDLNPVRATQSHACEIVCEAVPRVPSPLVGEGGERMRAG